MEKIDFNKAISLKSLRIGNVLFITVDGHGGSGKSSFAKWLSEKLNSEVVRTDDFASWDNPLNWWPLVIERIFEPISKGAITLDYPRAKWWKNHNPESVKNQPVTSVMILEGVGSLRKEFREYIGLGVFIDTPKHICLERGIARDLASGAEREEIILKWKQYIQDEEVYFERDDPKGYADVIIDGTKPFEEQVF